MDKFNFDIEFSNFYTLVASYIPSTHNQHNLKLYAHLFIFTIVNLHYYHNYHYHIRSGVEEGGAGGGAHLAVT